MWIVKAMFILWACIILGIVTTDRYIAYAVKENAGRAIEQSLDAGIVAAGHVTDAQNGYVQLDETLLKRTIKETFRDNMNLDLNLENRLMKNTTFELDLVYDADGIPWMEVEFHTTVSFLLPNIEYPVDVARKIDFQSIYL